MIASRAYPGPVDRAKSPTAGTCRLEWTHDDQLRLTSEGSSLGLGRVDRTRSGVVARGPRARIRTRGEAWTDAWLVIPRQGELDLALPLAAWLPGTHRPVGADDLADSGLGEIVPGAARADAALSARDLRQRMQVVRPQRVGGALAPVRAAVAALLLAVLAVLVQAALASTGASGAVAAIAVLGALLSAVWTLVSGVRDYLRASAPLNASPRAALPVGFSQLGKAQDGSVHVVDPLGVEAVFPPPVHPRGAHRASVERREGRVVAVSLVRADGQALGWLPTAWWKAGVDLEQVIAVLGSAGIVVDDPGASPGGSRGATAGSTRSTRLMALLAEHFYALLYGAVAAGASAAAARMAGSDLAPVGLAVLGVLGPAAAAAYVAARKVGEWELL